MKKKDFITDRILERRLEQMQAGRVTIPPGPRSRREKVERWWLGLNAVERATHYENELRLYELEKKVSGSASTSDLIPCKPGTPWEQITITLIDDETVRIKTPKGEKPYTFQMLGMAHKQKPNKPREMWTTLMIFAECEGSFKGSLGDHKRLLDKHLQELFHIDESIYTGHAKKTGGHKTRIVFRSEVHRSITEPKAKYQEPSENPVDDLIEAIDIYRNI